MHMTALGLAACLAAGLAGPCWAQDLKATPRLSDTQVGFDPAGHYGNYTLTVTGPNKFHASASSNTGTPAIDLRRFGGYDDGLYNYQLSGSTEEKVAVRSRLNNGRETRQADPALKSVSISGTFAVKGGAIIKPSAAKPTRHDKDAQ